MQNITISKLFVYPLKSSKGMDSTSINILKTGVEFDRYFAVINSDNSIITARENPKLLAIECYINKEQIKFRYPDKENLEIDLTNTKSSSTKIKLFKKDAFGELIDTKADKWITAILEEPCKLVKIDVEKLRTTKGESVATQITFTDAFPIHIVTTASINDLNSKLETSIIDNRFRPNIIISGTKPYEEKHWKTVRIGTCEFDVIVPTERCSLITIDSNSLERNKKQEPLRTLAKNKGTSKKVNFGIYLVPKNTGTIQKTDSIAITL